MKKAILICTVILFIVFPVHIYANGNIEVWVTPEGERYHDDECRYAHQLDSYSVPLGYAVETLGRTPCQICHPPTYDGSQFSDGIIQESPRSTPTKIVTPTPEVVYVEKEAEQEDTSWKIPTGIGVGAGAVAVANKLLKRKS